MPSIETLDFGRTAHASTRTLFGAAALGFMSERRAASVLEVLLEFGVNHIDVAASYGDAELRLAPWLERHRDRFFLATKTRERSREGARAEIARSLERLGVERVDLIQLHNLVDEAEWEQALGPDGALEACLEARDRGLVRFIGVTGHGTRAAEMHGRSLDRFPFDSVLLPYNFSMMQQPGYARDFEALDARCRRDGVAVQTIKSVARRRWRNGEAAKFSWYEPLRDPEAIANAVRFVLARPGVFLNTSSDATILRDTLVAASDAEGPWSPASVRADVARHAIEPLFVRGVSDQI